MKKLCFLLMVVLWIPAISLAQDHNIIKEVKLMTIRGTVKEDRTLKPVRNVEIQVGGTKVYHTNSLGDFKIEAKVGDEIVIRHDSFQTVRYIIQNKERIDVKVVENPETNKKTFSKRKKVSAVYNINLNAARKNLKKDAATSIDYVAKALETITDDDPSGDKKKAELYETLGDIYAHWKQPDLAVSKYRTSLSNKYSAEVKIKLGQAQLQNKDYQGALTTFTALKGSRLTNTQKTKVFEGLGDSNKGLQDFANADSSYRSALSSGKKKQENDDKIRLNSKIADVLDQQGNSSEAEEYLDNSVQMATNSTRKTAALQRTKAADFYSKNNSYEKEIELRQQALEDIEQIPEAASDSIVSTEESDDRALTSQVQNYKIANAFAAQKEYDEAINYLNESKKEAESKNDLVVQKDAARKLGEVYREKGELKKASEAFEEYEVIVDKLYIKKEQEISQATRFSRELAQRANRITTLEKDRELNETKYQLAFASQEISNQKSLRQQIIIYALIGLMALLLLAAYLMYRNIKQQRYANNVLALKSLRSQMNPHFIFNALNSVNTFIAISDERTANKYLTDFSLLMRAVLENSEEDFIPLEKEIELLELYVQLEHFRFQDKFEYTVYVDPEIDVKEYVIPPMLLQPYVENAVWHGLRYKEEKGTLNIAFQKKSQDTIEISITDDGIGRKKSKELKTMNQKLQKSKGMGNIKKRIAILNTMYKDKVDVHISDLNDKEEGTQVRLLLKKDK